MREKEIRLELTTIKLKLQTNEKAGLLTTTLYPVAPNQEKSATNDY